MEKWITRMTRKGGKARAESLTPERRQEIAAQGGAATAENRTAKERSEAARLAARARWGPAKAAKKAPSS